MRTEQTFYGLKCDRCKILYEGGEYSYWSDENSAIEEATDWGEWHEEGNKHYCPNCHDKDEETDEVTIFPEIPREIKKIFELCNVLGYGAVISDLEKFFVIDFRIAHREPLEDFEKDYIKNHLKGKLEDIVHEEKVYNSQKIKIVIQK